MLVAGCGTSQAAKYALRNPAHQVTAIDISDASVRHSKELTSTYCLINLDIENIRVEEVGDLGRRFDRIICTGVLHHLPDPLRGLQALRQVVLPGGALHMMVYAPYCRIGVYMIQDYCRRLSIEESAADIDELAATLRALPPDHPLGRLLDDSTDFRSRAGIADALLHPQDRSYTVPEVFEFLREGGFTFGRWIRQAPYLANCGDIAKTPHSRRISQLQPEDQYAAVELLRGTMVRHSVIAYPTGSAEHPHLSSPDADCHEYTPMRLPETLTVRKHLPAGAAAVPINPQHTYRDLYLPITAAEVALLRRIDGEQTIGEILSGAPCDSLTGGLDFFYRLWQYDQIVLRATSSAT